MTPLLWSVRGVADKLIGGVGMRRGRRNPDTMWVGDAVDFWRVEAVERRLADAAPGRDEAAGRGVDRVADRAPRAPAAASTQRAIFYPRGLLGRLYWYTLIPFHALIFKQMAERVADAATHAGPPPAVEPRPGPQPLVLDAIAARQVRPCVESAGSPQRSFSTR